MDSGKEFIAEVIQNLCTLLGVKIIHGCPYHPEEKRAGGKFQQTCKKEDHISQGPPDEQAKFCPHILT